MEYCHLPGILSDRLANLSCDLPNDQISEKSFIDNFIKIFISDFATKMRFTFQIYDFDNDGVVTKEDIRLILSYIPLNRSAVSGEGVIDILDKQFEGSGKDKEGLYEADEGKNLK